LVSAILITLALTWFAFPMTANATTFQLDNSDATGADTYLQQDEPTWNNGGYAWGVTVRSYGSWGVNKDFSDAEATRVYALAVYDDGNGEKLYAGTYNYGRIYVYNGTSWSQSNETAASRIFCSLAVYDNKLYAGRDDGKIYVKSGTGSWGLAQSFASENNIWSLAVYNDGTGEKLYAGAYSGKVYVYDGSSWSTSTQKETSSGGERFGSL